MFYNSLSPVVSEDILGNVDFYSPFFDVFREAYDPYFTEWWKRKRNDTVYIVKDQFLILGFLKLKIENINEDYGDITPDMQPKKRLKICSLKVDSSLALGLGSYFMQIIFNEAIQHNVAEIYGTVAINSEAKESIVNFLEKWGFFYFGKKFSHNVEEAVYVNNSSYAWKDMLFSINFKHQ